MKQTAARINGEASLPPLTAKVGTLSASTSHPSTPILNTPGKKYVLRDIKQDVGCLVMPVLPPALLSDVLAFSGSSLKLVAPRPQEWFVELKQEETRLRSQRAAAEANERAEELYKFESLIRAEGLNGHPHGRLLRQGEVYGQGKHSVVYHAEVISAGGNGVTRKDQSNGDIRDPSKKHVRLGR